MDESSRDLSDPENSRFLSDPSLIGRLDHTLSPAEVTPEEYGAILYAGGHGVTWDLPENEELARIAATLYDAGGIVAAVCHGPAGLVNVRRRSPTTKKERWVSQTLCHFFWRQNFESAEHRFRLPKIGQRTWR
jgi:putative intracellular protease/amidase